MGWLTLTLGATTAAATVAWRHQIALNRAAQRVLGRIDQANAERTRDLITHAGPGAPHRPAPAVAPFWKAAALYVDGMDRATSETT